MWQKRLQKKGRWKKLTFHFEYDVGELSLYRSGEASMDLEGDEQADMSGKNYAKDNFEVSDNDFEDLQNLSFRGTEVSTF